MRISMLKIIASFICFGICIKGFEEDNNFMFWGGIVGICGFLLWELNDVWEVVGFGLM